MKQGWFKPKLKAITSLLPHGLPTGQVVTNLVGKHLAGKSLLALQLAYEYAAKKNGNILILDVDGGATMFVESWKDIFEARFEANPKVFIEICQNTKRWVPSKSGGRKMHIAFDLKIYEAFGVKAVAYLTAEQVTDRETKMAKVVGGKTEFIPYALTDDKVEDYIENKDVKVVIVDSFSQIYKDCFIGMQSFGERARAEDFLFGRIKEVGLRHPDTLIILNHHHTLNPMTGGVDIAGGAAVLQNSKLALYIERLESKKYYGLARLYVFRYPNIAPWSKSSFMVYTDIGFVDMTREIAKQYGIKVEELAR